MEEMLIHYKGKKKKNYNITSMLLPSREKYSRRNKYPIIKKYF